MPINQIVKVCSETVSSVAITLKCGPEMSLKRKN